MKIAVPSLEKNIESLAESRFGRAPYFIVFDTQTHSFHSIENLYSKAVSGAGGQAVRLLSDQDVDVLLLPEVGPKAMEAIRTFDLKAYRYGQVKPVTEVIEAFKKDELELVLSESHEGHHGSDGLYRA